MAGLNDMKILIAVAHLAAPAAGHAASRAQTALDQYRLEAAAAPPVPIRGQVTAPSDLSDPRLFQARGRDAAPARPRGTVQTALDRRFGNKATGSLGYLCGLAPGPHDNGGVRSSSDPAGTFLGGQFKVTF